MLRYGRKTIDKLTRAGGGGSGGAGGADGGQGAAATSCSRAKAKRILVQHRCRGRNPQQHRKLSARMTRCLVPCTALQLAMTRLVRVHVHAQLQRGCCGRIAAAALLVDALRHRGTLCKLRAKQHGWRRAGELKIIVKAAAASARSRRRHRRRRSSSSCGGIACCRLQWLQCNQAGQLHETLGVRMCRS